MISFLRIFRVAAVADLDADGDVVGNFAEWIMGTDPVSSASGPGRLTVSLTSGTVTVIWPERLDHTPCATLVLSRAPIWQPGTN